MDSQPTSRPFPGFDHLYTIYRPHTAFYVEIDPGIEADIDALALTRAEAVLPQPLRLCCAGGRLTPSDVIWSTSFFLVIVHKRVVDLLLDHRLTGWRTYPVEIYGKQSEPVADYVGLSFTGRCGLMDGSRSTVVMKQWPGRLSPQWVGMYFPEDSWDGSDFFMSTKRTGSMFVTEPVVKAFRKAKIGPLKFERMDKIELDFDPETGKSDVDAVIAPGPTGAMPEPAGGKEVPNDAHSYGVATRGRLSERPVKTDIQREIVDFAREALDSLDLSAQAGPTEIVQAIERRIEALRPLSGKELTDRATELGALLGQQVGRTVGWQWIEVLGRPDQEDGSFAVAPKDRAVALFPVHAVAELLKNRRRDINLALLFGMIESGHLPPAAAGDYEALA